MADDEYTEITSQSWGSRIKGSLSGTLIGLILFLGAFPLLFWNEGRAVRTAKALDEGAGIVIAVSPDQVQAANQGKLVHLSGTPATEETLSDPLFGVRERALKLRRVVEMYQWQESSRSETKEKLGGGTETHTTYSYSRTWVDHPVSSSGFKKPDGHQNPGEFPFKAESSQAKEVTLGAFRLSAGQVASLSHYQQIIPTPEVVAQARTVQSRRVTQEGSNLILGDRPAEPQVGDLRVRFEAVKPEPISLVAQQQGNSFVPYQARSGADVDLLDYGIKTPEAMFKAAQDENKVLTWVIRLVGALVMFIGLRALLGVLETLAAVIPFLGSLVGFGISLVAGVLALSLSLVTIGIAWIFYRPLLGSILLAGAALALFGLKGARRTPAVAAARSQSMP